MDKYIIDGVEYSRGEEVEVSDLDIPMRWIPRKFISYQPERENYRVRVEDVENGIFQNYKYIRKIQPTQCKIDYDAPKNLFDAEVSKYFSEIEKYLYSTNSIELNAFGKQRIFNAFKYAYKDIKEDILLRNYLSKPLSGRKAKLILEDGTEYSVTVE